MRKPRARYHHGDLHEAALAAAAKEIDAHGHVGFSLERVAKSVGVTPAALYRHFANRDALLRETMWRTFLAFVLEVDAAALQTDAPDPLRAIGLAYARFGVQNPGWFRLQFSREGAKLSERQASARPQYADVMQRELAALFDDDDAQVGRWHVAMWAFVHGITAMAVERMVPTLTTDADRLALADEQLATFLGGLRAAAAAPRPMGSRRPLTSR